MKAANIRVGMILKLKQEVLQNSTHADGTAFASPLVQVSAITERKGYSVPWIRNAEGDAFKPSDFQSAVEQFKNGRVA